MSGPEPLQPIPNATQVLRTRPQDPTFEADFADLVSRFTAQSGGGLSPELSSDLALEIVLNEVVEQACLATGATGAAIVLIRDGELVCRATSGATAPELGSRLDSESGISGVSIRTRRTERCDDALTDPRVDTEASRRLGVRSVMVMPLIRREELAGLFELFSPLPHVFGERDERTLEVLAARILNNLEHAAKPQPAVPFVSAEILPEADLPREEVPEVEAAPEAIAVPAEVLPQPGFDFVNAALGISVLACAVLLGILLGQHFRLQKMAKQTRQKAAAALTTQAAVPPAESSSGRVKTSSGSSTAVPAKSADDPVPPGSMRVFDKGKEIFRMRGEGDESSGAIQAASARERVLELSPSAAESQLLHRVEPEYPEAARQQGIQGAVVLDVHIGVDGAVQDLQVVSGPEALRQASSDAVKQWKFRARGSLMQTRVTLNFRLP